MDYHNYAALIFDMDGTLLDTMPMHEIAWRNTLEHFELPIRPELMRSLVGVPTKETLEIISDASSKRIDFHAASAFKARQVSELMQQGIQATPIADIAHQYHGIRPLAIGTGADCEEAEFMLRSAGLFELFDVIIGADLVHAPKPDPHTFVLAAERLGVEPSQCVVFEDGEPGLVAARAGDMAAVDIRKLWQPEQGYFA